MPSTAPVIERTFKVVVDHVGGTVADEGVELKALQQQLEEEKGRVRVLEDKIGRITHLRVPPTYQRPVQEVKPLHKEYGARRGEPTLDGVPHHVLVHHAWFRICSVHSWLNGAGFSSSTKSDVQRNAAAGNEAEHALHLYSVLFLYLYILLLLL
ncbi:unnamed protein product [Cylicocyclus nassatus]|uniref:Uncharacterized protein n=1 Tax=Cylicocyclus nassatus TaxID=53992 RepID=A0AA36HER1_CYLNA|nr:unnamed protein product [Cylicocyclus nassatus]